MIIGLFASLFAQSGFSQSLKPEVLYQKLLPSVMTLNVETIKGESYIGTGFLALDKNVAVTAWHVISDATNVSAKFSDNQIVKVVGVIDHDEAMDLALIRLEDQDRPQATVHAVDPMVGSRAYVIGAPKGFNFSITDGLISQVQMIRGAEQYQISCPISGGNSGGPVLNDQGEVLGIVAWTKTDAQNLSFAIPATYLSHLDPHRPVVPWRQLAGLSLVQAKPSRPVITPNSMAVSEREKNVTELKKLLKNSVGKRLTITVAEGNSEKKFNLIVPDDLVQ